MFRLEFWRIQEIAHFMAFYVSKAVSEATKPGALLEKLEQKFACFSHVMFLLRLVYASVQQHADSSITRTSMKLNMSLVIFHILSSLSILNSDAIETI